MIERYIPGLEITIRAHRVKMEDLESGRTGSSASGFWRRRTPGSVLEPRRIEVNPLALIDAALIAIEDLAPGPDRPFLERDSAGRITRASALSLLPIVDDVARVILEGVVESGQAVVQSAREIN